MKKLKEIIKEDNNGEKTTLDFNYLACSSSSSKYKK